MKETTIYWYDTQIKLPKNGTDCLILDGKDVKFAHYSCNEFDEPYFGQDIGSSYKEVTYWAYLPDLPNKADWSELENKNLDNKLKTWENL